jgi:hypothetical protein
MEQQQVNKVLALAGSFCLSNGLMLLVAPARFAGLRKMNWLPAGVNRSLDSLAGDTRLGRLVGALVGGRSQRPSALILGPTRCSPDPNPPKPLVSFDHTDANGVDFSHDGRFDCVGDARGATPGLQGGTGRHAAVADRRLRSEPDRWPASSLPNRGFERPSHCQFGPDEALYGVDYGAITIAPEKGGIRTPLRLGALWRIRRTEGPPGEPPPMSVAVPIHGVKHLGIAAGVLGALALLVRLAVRLARGRQG